MTKLDELMKQIEAETARPDLSSAVLPYCSSHEHTRGERVHI